ncbi:ribosome-associated translation inhibitor RaiA [bacterium]|nr:ribosome-associated translation inhibitor RaiA [bacterium]
MFPINITGRHMEITPAIRSYIKEKVNKVEKHFDHILDVQVIISVDNHRHIVEIILKTNVSIISVKKESEDMYASIDLCIEKLDKQLKKLKERLKEHKHHREPRIDELVSSEEIKLDEDHAPGFIFKQVEISPMDIEEARMQLDVMKYAFLMFIRVDTDVINVIHKTKGGDYVVLEPANL